jgi:molybdopterin-guanine dinucleotide biosynthesis protein
LELRAIGLVTGEAGSGKTTVCRKVAAALHPGLYRVFYVPLSTGNVMDMYKGGGRLAPPATIYSDGPQ